MSNRQRRASVWAFRLVLATGTLVFVLLLVDVSLSLLLRHSLLPAGVSAAIHGTSLHTRLIADTLPSREPGLDVSYEIDRERYGDLVEKGLVVPDRDSGDGTETVRLRTDRFGFRSVEDHESCDVVILGDSITEAANLGENAPYPLRLDRRMPLRICNLSIAAVGTLQQRDYLRRFGLPRGPRLVVLAFFEGNDLQDNVNFSRIRERQRNESALRTVLRRRPLLRLGNSAFRSLTEDDHEHVAPPRFNPIEGRIGEREILLAFIDSYIDRLSRSVEEIESSAAWKLTRSLLDEIREDSAGADVSLLVVFFPSKPHVYGSFLRTFADPEQLRAYASTRAGESGQAFVDRLESNADATRDVLQGYCRQRSIEFLDLLQPLRAAVASGRKVFLTYDTHMTAAGQEVVADALEPELIRLTMAF